jgi:Phage P22-like portal protein
MAYQDSGVTEAGAISSGGSKSDRDKGEILATMRTRLTMAISAYSDSREDELDDLRFRAASPDNQWQWPADVLATRGSIQGQTINARPCLTINKLPQHVLQVTNDQRQNRPSGKVIPADDKADIEVAEIFNGIVRHIEYISDADVAYDTACDNQVTFGEGYFRIYTEYCDDNSFEQDLRIGRIRDSFSVYMDPTIQDPCGSDAEWCFVCQELTKEDYERQFPDSATLSSLQYGVGDGALNAWINQDTVRIAEYFYIQHENKTLNQYHGNISAMAGSKEAKQAEEMGLKPIKTREVDVKTVKWCKTNGFEMLEEKDWAGKYIPVIRVIGNEFEIDGRMYISGIIRNAKDAQRMYNYWASQEAEMLALAPKAPFIGYGGQFEGYENQWKTANINNWPYLEVNPDVTDGQGGPLPLPARSQPPMASSGLLQAKMGAADDIKGTTGQYDASLGSQSNETSGRAILAREKQGDTGTYHFVDNLARAIRYSTRQLVDIIPKIYDTQRIARIIGIDGETDQAMIDPTQPMPVRKIVDQQTGATIKKIYNPSVGKYDVVSTTGPSYMTKRQESLDAMSRLLQGNPNLWAVAGDLFIKNMDWPGAQEMSQRFAKTIDPKLLNESDASPELAQAQQQMQAMGKEMDQMHMMLQNVSKSMEAQDLQVKQFDSQVKAYDAETKRISAVQAGMSEEQIQDIVMGTVHGMITSGDLVNEMPGRDQDMPGMPEMPQEGMEQGMPQPGMPQMPQQGVPQ